MENTLNYIIKDPLELNLSYITFVNDGGLFIPTKEIHALGSLVSINLQLPKKNTPIKFIGKVVWITFANALFHALPGVGVQFIGSEAKAIREEIEACLDASMDLSGYTCGIIESQSKTSVS